MLWRRLFGYLPANVVAGLASFGAVWAYTRLLGPEGYGWYALALAGLNLVYTLTATWAEGAAYRFSGEGGADQARTTFLALLMSGAVACAVLLAVAAGVESKEFGAALMAAAFAALLLPFANAAREMARARQDVGRYAMSRMLQDAGAFGLGVMLALRFGLGPAAPFAGLACVLAGIAVVEGRALWRAGAGGQARGALLRRDLAYGLPLAGALALHLALDAGDRFVIAALMGPEAVGVYAAGYGVADKLVGLVAAWAAAASAPALLAAWREGGAKAAGEASGQVLRMIVFVAAPAAVGVALVARPLAEVMVAATMRDEAARIMPWIAASGLIAALAMHYAAEAFVVGARTGRRALLLIVPVVLNLGLNVALIPHFGLMGAVWATLASYGAALALLAAAGRSVVPLAWPVGGMARIAGACGVMAAVVVAVPDVGGLAELALKAAAGATAYSLAAIVLDAGGVRPLVLAAFRTVFRRGRRAGLNSPPSAR
jgi:O-antigen/teichoic acid export membrane protein